LRVHEGALGGGDDWDADIVEADEDSVCAPGRGRWEVELFTFRSLQMASVTVFNGAGRWNVVNPVPGVAHVKSVLNKFVFR